MKPGYLIKILEPRMHRDRKVAVYNIPRIHNRGVWNWTIVEHFTETDVGVVIESTSNHEGWIRILLRGNIGWIYPSHFETLKRISK